jgi:hypothetical protein
LVSITSRTSKRRLISTIKLSPREGRLIAVLRKSSWINSHNLCIIEFGDDEKKWPLNARKIITTTMNTLDHKLQFERCLVNIDKRGNGGRAGVEYRLT